MLADRRMLWDGSICLTKIPFLSFSCVSCSSQCSQTLADSCYLNYLYGKVCGVISYCIRCGKWWLRSNWIIHVHLRCTFVLLIWGHCCDFQLLGCRHKVKWPCGIIHLKFQYGRLFAVVFVPTNNPFLLYFYGVSPSSSSTASVDVDRIAVYVVIIWLIELCGEDGWEYCSDSIKYVLLVAISS